MTRLDESHCGRFNRPILQSVLIVTLLVAAPARAVSIVESINAPGGDFSTGSFSVGALALGSNSVSGSLSGNCVIGDCNNGVTSGDSQDSFVIQIAGGTQLDSIIVTTANVSGPPNFTASFQVDTVGGIPFLPLGSSTANFLGSPLGAGSYRLSVYGQGASQAGAFALDWNIGLGVQAVPLPAAVWLLGSAVGLLGWIKRKSTS